MRQAVTMLLVGLWLYPSATARGEGPPPAGEPLVVTEARRLVQAGDCRAAVGLLEDALIDGPAADRPAVVEALRRSYETMAREAEAAGRADVAARYRDDLAILERAHGAARSSPSPGPRSEPARPRPEPARPPVELSRPRVAPARPRAEPAPPGPPPSPSERVEPAGSASPDAIRPPSAGAEPPAEALPPELRAPLPDPTPSEPAPLPEPARLPTPGPMTRPTAAPETPATSALPRVDAAVGTASNRSPDRQSAPPVAAAGGPPEAREVLINPGEAVATAGPAPVEAAPAPSPRPRPGPVAAASPRPSAGTSDLAAADRLFRARNFEQAGRIYGSLSARELLPADRKPHWAYCRIEAVVRRINAGPRSSREWDAIEEEVKSIRRLAPGNWYGEYLANKVAEARRSQRRRGKAANDVVVRGSSPEDPSPSARPRAQAPPRRRPGRLGRAGGTPASPAPGGPTAADADRSLNLPGSLNPPGSLEIPDNPPAPGPGAAATPAPAPTSGEAGSIAWQVRETTNFRILHCDPALAERAAEVAESVRTAQARRWESAGTRAPWSPRCDLYLYPTARLYAEATGQPETSPGLSTLSNNGVRVLSRTMSMRADNPLLLTATLPHEVTHVVLADLFVDRPIPRWADEGLAVLSEPPAEMRLRQADLKGPLESGRVFDAAQLMAMDLPDPRDWRLFYAQSVSLTQFLVDRGPPARFIQFVRDSQRLGTEAALRDVYHIDGLAALQERWLDYARKQVAVDVASSREPAEDLRRD